MNSEITPDLKSRLIGSKMLFLNGIETLEKGAQFSAAFATLNFQDSAEIFLRVIAEHLGAEIKHNIPFHQIIDNINKKLEAQSLSHTTELNQLNNVRNSFKHSVIKPNLEDVKKFRVNLESFFKYTTENILGFNYNELSLVNLIKHQRTENFLQKAEAFLDETDYENSVLNTAIGFAVFRRHHAKINKITNYEPSHRSPNDQFTDNLVKKYADKVDETLLNHEFLLHLISNGINVIDFKKFDFHTPNIAFAYTGNYIIQDAYWNREKSSNYETALFCLNFVINAILHLKNNTLPVREYYDIQYIELEVIRNTDIILYPCEEPEIIRTAKTNEKLLTYGKDILDSDNEFIAIIQDSETAYVKRSAVVKINVEN